MPALSAGNLTILRSRPVGRDWYLYIFQPELLWSGTVGGAPEQGDRTLTVTTVSGNPANILADMTCRVTTAAGALKIAPSKVRVKSHNGASPGVMVVAENAINWVAGDIVSVYRLFELWPRIPYIDPDSGEQFKDRDIAWSSDAEAQPPKANAGPAAIATLSGGQVDIVFKNEGSFSCPGGGGVASYAWTALGGAPAVVAGNPATSTVTYRYTTSGYYYVRLVVTDANGETGTVYVPVIIDDGTESLARVVPGDRGWDRHGWALSRRLIGIDADDTVFYDGAPAFLVADDSQVADEAFVDNRDNLRWSGWLTQDDTDRTAYGRGISYRAVSTAHILENIPAYPVAFRSDAAPADWYEFTDLSINSVAYLLLRWQSTLCEVCDYHAFTEDEWAGGASERLRPGENCDAQDLLSQVNAVLGAAKGNLRCDRQGIVRAQRHEWFLSTAEQAARATVLTLQNGDFTQANFGPHHHRARVRETRLSGVDGSGTPFISGAPGPSPLDGGRPVEVTRLSPLDQTELNQWAGQELAIENWDAIVRLRMSGEFDCVEPARGEFIAGTLSAFDARVPDGLYSVIGVTFEDDHLLGFTRGEWLLMSEPGMYEASARPIPAEPPPPPPPPPVIPPEVPEEIPTGTGDVVIVGTVGIGVCYTLNAVSGSPPTWATLNNGLADTSFIESLVKDPLAPSFNLACIDGSGEVYTNDGWRDGNAWALALTEAAALAMVAGAGSVSLTHLVAATFNNLTYLFCVALYGPTATGEIRVLYSSDWGANWSILNAANYAFGTYYSCATCSIVGANYGPYIRIFKKSSGISAGTANGQLLVSDNGTLILAGGSYTGALSRPNAVAMYFGTGGGAWSSPVYAFENCTPPPFCFPSTNVDWFAAVGGDKALGQNYTGAGASCMDSNGTTAYFGAWRYHYNDDISEPMGFGSAGIESGIFTMVGQVNDGWAYQRGMMDRPPLLSAHDYLALYVNTDDETELYISSIADETWTFDEPCRQVRAFPNLVDDLYAVLYVGRSHVAGERASAGDEALFYVSKLDVGIIGEGWTDKSGNLYALGARGITDIEFDTSSD